MALEELKGTEARRDGGPDLQHDSNRSAPNSLEEEGLLGGSLQSCETFVPILCRAAMMHELSVDMTAASGGPWPLSTAPHLTQSSLARTNVPDASRWTEHSGWMPGFSSSLSFNTLNMHYWSSNRLL